MSEEILDVFNEDGEWQSVAPRSEVHRVGLWHKTSQVWLLNERHELLLQFRSAEKDCFPSLWDISSAGHIPAGCDPIVSAVRELDEELGVHCTEDDLQFLFTLQDPYLDERSGHIDREISLVYLLRVPSAISFVLQKEEVDSVRWLDYRKLIKDFESCREEYVPHEKHFRKLVPMLDKLLAGS